MYRFDSIVELKKWRATQKGSVGFVPTMGALHEGHASLLKCARKETESVVLSIFVNPAQFGPLEDFSKYPRTLEQDIAMARREGVTAVFCPSVNEVYPPGFSTYIEENHFSKPLCGEFRPGHFRGVTTIVYRLLQWVEPHFSYFGLKDAQQFFVLKKMVHDLELPLKLVGCPTVRESSGLALSSRNQYLLPQEREKAALIYQELTNLKDQGLSKKDFQLPEAIKRLEAVGMRVQYLRALDVKDFQPLAYAAGPGETLIAFAGFMGATRLIDNVIF